ncbi:hypothetical protein [Nannocystis sp.]|uniref:hypothetical protein n=1 Tax=Nannocystis sp. TaxID=1962667 RepID=UPI0025FE7529|nr:hypothetical protein [Nannocystis sp.]
MSSDAQGVHLNFVHTIFVREDRDELYAGALFTTTEGEPCPMASLCGSVAVFAGASQLDGPQVATRSLFGPTTTLRLPHGVWVDETRDILYVANTFAGSILVWDKASEVDGDIKPDRTITWQDMGAPVYIYVDAATDRAFVAAMPMIGGKQPQVLIYENISTRNGPSLPNLLVAGPNTRLDIGNPTTHNTWFIAKGRSSRSPTTPTRCCSTRSRAHIGATRDRPRCSTWRRVCCRSTRPRTTRIWGNGARTGCSIARRATECSSPPVTRRWVRPRRTPISTQ